MNPIDVGLRVRQLRTANGISASELCDLLSVSAATLSRLEKGHMPTDDEVLEKMAVALKVAPEFLLRPVPDLLATKPWLRAYADAPKKAVDRIHQENQLAVEQVIDLSLQRMPDLLPAFGGDLDDMDAIEDFASEVRELAGLDEGAVVGNMTRAAEKLGCFILPMPGELGRHLGLSSRVDDVPLIRASRPTEDPERSVPGDRQRFTVAHELGHLTLHSNKRPPSSAAEAKQIEKQAHRFAAAFLLPGDALIEDLHEVNSSGRVTLNTLVHLKQRWGAAIKAMVVRFNHLGVIDNDHSRSLYKQISHRRWSTHEPVEVGNEAALWFGKALARRFGEDPAAGAAKHAKLDREYFDSWLDWSPQKVAVADVITLRNRPIDDSDDNGAHFGLAPVTDFPVRGFPTR